MNIRRFLSRVIVNQIYFKVKIHDFEVKVSPYEVWFWAWVDTGTWEKWELETIDKILDKNVTFIDIGAHAGAFTLMGAKKAKQVVAVEPDVAAVLGLISNLRLNNLESNVTILQAALLSRNGFTDKVTLNKNGDGTSRYSNSIAASEQGNLTPGAVQSFSTSDFFQEFCSHKKVVVKMDIEGSEWALLLEAKEFISKVKPSFLVAFHLQDVDFDPLERIIDAFEGYLFFSNSNRQNLPITSISLQDLSTSDILFHMEPLE
jgi:FkbM family methyltransferase